MKLHHGAHKIILSMLTLAIIDLVTHNLWCIMLYLSIWSIVLLRQSTRVAKVNGITSPVSGIVTKVFKSTSNRQEVQCIKIITRPIIDPQTFRPILVDTIESVKAIGSTQSILYRSGLLVRHVPYLDMINMILNQENLEPFAQAEADSVYGSSIFGCTTLVMLSPGVPAAVVEGQKVIDGETIIGGKL